MAINMYSSGQRSMRGQPKKKDPWLYMLQARAASGEGARSVSGRMQSDLAEQDRSQSQSNWQSDFNLNQKAARTAADAAQTGVGLKMIGLGSNIGSKYGSSGTRWGGDGASGGVGMGTANSWGSKIGGALGGAGIGYGIASVIGSKSDKNKKWGTALGGLAGLLGFL